MLDEFVIIQYTGIQTNQNCGYHFAMILNKLQMRSIVYILILNLKTITSSDK